MSSLRDKIEAKFTDQFFASTEGRNDKRREAIVAICEAERIEAPIDELKWARDMAEKDVTGQSLISLNYINQRISKLEATLKGGQDE